MAKARRITAAALVAVMALAVALKAEENGSTIVIHVANHAAVPADVLADAMERVTVIFNMIGVRTRWDDRGATITRVQDGEWHLSVLLLSREMGEKKSASEGGKSHVWGQAHPPTGRAYVFYGRIAEQRQLPVVLAARVGDVIAHEVGHLLLRTSGHARTGIMRPSLAAHSVLPRTFNGTDARTIRDALATPR